MTQFTELLTVAIKNRIEEIIKEEADRAADIVRQRVNQEADRLALQILQMYDVQCYSDRLVITVKKVEAK